MIKVCVLIGEGDSERYFLPALMSNKAGFAAEMEKSPFLYKKENTIFWFFPFPPGCTAPVGGKAVLKKPEIYRTVHAIIQTNLYLFDGAPVEFHFRVLVDKDECDVDSLDKTVEKITTAITNSKVVIRYDIAVVENKIECWYFAGLDENFPKFQRGKEDLIKKYLVLKPEDISDPKSRLEEVLDPSLKGAIKLGQVMGENFNVEKALRVSVSFKRFWDSLKKDGLI